MATVVAGALFGARSLFKYNRKNYFFDRKLKQKCDHQEQNLRVEQFALYREDVRDLVEMTVAKMEVYMVAAALLIDRTTVMITKAKEALPVGSPDWAIALNAMSLAAGVFYLFLCLWLAMYASIAAQSYGTRMLTQFLRLPIVSQSHIARAAAAGANYEERSIGNMLRIPLVQSNQGGFFQNEGSTASSGSAASSSAAPSGAPAGSASAAVSASSGSAQPPGGSASRTSAETAGEAGSSAESASGSLPSEGTFITAPPANDPLNIPAQWLEHIRIYRRLQLNWQAYDAYARVCLFAGINSLLYCCMYWSLGSFLKGQRAAIPAFAVALIFSSIQVVLTKLDLGLSRQHVIPIGLLLASTPIITTAGMLLFEEIDDKHAASLSWQRIVMRACAVLTHALHTVVAILLMRAAQPEKGSDGDALLPSKFDSLLFLDVFGWLLNPTGPGIGVERTQEDEEEDAVDSPGTSFYEGSDAGSPTSPRSPRRPRSRAGSSFSELSSPTDLRPPGRSRSFGGAASEAASELARSSTVLSRQRSMGARSRTATSFSTISESGSRRTEMVRSLRKFGGELAESFVGGADSNRRSRLRQEMARIDFGNEFKEDARNLFHVGSSNIYEGTSQAASSSQEVRTLIVSGNADTQETRFGGTQSVAAEAFIGINEPTAVSAAHFVPSSARPRQFNEKVELPGQAPWGAFRRGTGAIVVLWFLSTFWAAYKSVEEFMEKHDDSATFAALKLQQLPLNSGHFLLGPLCHQHNLSLGQEQRHGKIEPLSWQLRQLLSHQASRDHVLLNTGCRVHSAPLDISADCRLTSDAPGQRCYVAVLQRGRRAVSLCGLRQQGRVLQLWPLARMRLVPGLPALESLAIHRQDGQLGLTGLQLFGRAGGALLALRVQLGAQGALHRSKLVPMFEVETLVQGELSATPSMDTERLLVSAGTLLSLRPSLFNGEQLAERSQLTCSSGFQDGLQLRAWDLATGEQSEHWAPISPRVLGTRFRPPSPQAMGLLQKALCRGAVDTATA